MLSRRTLAAIALSIILISLRCFTAESGNLDIRPRPQIVNYRGDGLEVTGKTRILLPEGWPAYVRIAANELAIALKEKTSFDIPVIVQEQMKPGIGDIAIGPYWVIRPKWVEPLAQGLVRPAPDEGHNIIINERNVALMGNTPRACFQGLQTLIQIVRQIEIPKEGAYHLPGIIISDWPSHNWRTLQLHLVHTGSPFDRGQHVYRTATTAKVMEHSIKLAAYTKMTGLVVDVESGMTYDRHPENLTTGMSRNRKEDIRKAVDLAKTLGLNLVPKSNSSSGHDGWVIPYSFSATNTELYLEEMFDLYDEIIEVFRPAYFHVGLDEDTFHDLDSIALRNTELHKKILLADYNYLLRNGITMLMWNDGITQLGNDIADIPRDIIVHPWMYGGWDFTPSERHINQGFRILCSPWSCWHVENDQFFAIYAQSLKSDKCLGMAGTFWYPLGKDDTDYRRCLVKAADAFWNPTLACDYPNSKEYYSPEYSMALEVTLPIAKPTVLQPEKLKELISIVTHPGDNNLKNEAAREKLVSVNTAAVPPILDTITANPNSISPWAEGTLRRIVREPLGETEPMIAALRKASGTRGALRQLALELLAILSDNEYLEQQDMNHPEVAFAAGVSGDNRFLPALLAAVIKAGPARADALMAIGKLKGLDELLTLKSSWKEFDDACREAYARALAMQAAEKAIPVLSELADDSLWRVRFRAAVGLGATQSIKAGQAILTLLDDEDPYVFKTVLYWCTDTLILKPEEYFPKLCDRLTVDEDEVVVKPIIHSFLQMWDPQRGQWLSRNEDPSKRINYATLPVWKEKYFIDAMNRMIEYRNARHATYAMVLLTKTEAPLSTNTIVSAVKKYPIEDQRWFCERMREERLPQMVPVMKELWNIDDHLVRTFIIQYCSRIKTQDTFDLVYNGLKDIPEKNEQLRSSVVYTLAEHITKMDDNTRKAVPLVLIEFNKTNWPDGRNTLEKALCRAAGKALPENFDNTPEGVTARIAEWKKWWKNAEEEMD